MTLQFPCPVTTIFSRRVKPGSEAQYEAWLAGISQSSSSFPGAQGTTVLRPDEAHGTYMAIMQFDSADNLSRWMESDERAGWLEKLNSISLESQEIASMTGMERWFSLPDRSITQAPPKHKTALMVLVGLYPLVLLLTFLLEPVTGAWPTPLRVLASLAISIPVMVWGLMPQLTRLFFRWLYP